MKKKAKGFLKELVGAFKKGYGGSPKKKAVKRKVAKKPSTK